MKVCYGLDRLTPLPKECTVAIGRFDGVHVGHQSLISHSIADARNSDRTSVVLTFDKHPQDLFAPDRAPGYLMTLADKVDAISNLGADCVLVVEFDDRFRDISPEGFLHCIVSGLLRSRSVFVGPDFRYGRNQTGDANHLIAGEERYQYKAHVHETIAVDGRRAASSRIREYLISGHLHPAEVMLGRPYSMKGSVVHGKELGRQLGFPTANLQSAIRLVIPKDGIYAVWADVNGERHMGACSIGWRPTVNGTDRTIETYLLDFDGDLYDQEVELTFVERLRDELKFDGLEALTAQIKLDVEQTRAILHNRSRHTPCAVRRIEP